MTVRTIRSFGDPVLRDICLPVTRFDEGLVALVTDLMDTCRLPGRAGLAAPQIGVIRRVFSFNVDETEGYLINPELIESGGRQDGPEGCLSIGDLFLSTVRAGRAVAAGVDLENRRVEIEGTGLLARCFQHEIDHLDGHLYIDRLDAENRKRALKIIRNRQISATE
jgi:peptide deformylase